MIKDRSEMKRGPIEIDLCGPDGNAFVLLGLARRLAKQLGYTEEEIKVLMEVMMNGDYDDLVELFEKEFGDFVVLYK